MLIAAGYRNKWQAVADGDLDAAVEVWASIVLETCHQLHYAGRLEDLGALGLNAREGFVYPADVAEICQCLPDLECSEGLRRRPRFRPSSGSRIGRFPPSI